MCNLLLENLPEECQDLLMDKLSLGIEKVAVLRQRKSHTVYRIYTKDGNFILKCFQAPAAAKEIRVYFLLQKYDVPTLPFYGITDRVILLEDLDFSERWRCAGDGDMELSTTGDAVATWYQQLHITGFDVINKAEENLDYLQSWVDGIEQNALETVGKTLAVANSKTWKLALSKFEVLKEKYHSFPQTFNYNDFAAENLALSTTFQGKSQAIVFDYNQFSIGTVYSDWRNVIYSLRGKARETFSAAYGEVSECERRLDDVLSVLHGLVIAIERDTFPKWALPLKKSIENGELDKCIRAALEIL